MNCSPLLAIRGSYTNTITRAADIFAVILQNRVTFPCEFCCHTTKKFYGVPPPARHFEIFVYPLGSMLDYSRMGGQFSDSRNTVETEKRKPPTVQRFYSIKQKQMQPSVQNLSMKNTLPEVTISLSPWG